MSGEVSEIVLIGRDRERVEGHVSDLRDAALYSHSGRIDAGDFTDCTTADVIIVTVGAAQSRDKRTRLDDLSSSVAMVEEVITDIARHAPTGVLVMASNPVGRSDESFLKGLLDESVDAPAAALADVAISRAGAAAGAMRHALLGVPARS